MNSYFSYVPGWATQCYRAKVDEAADPGPDGQPPARLTLGLENADGISPADNLHVRQGQNYLVTGFVRMERLRDDPQVMGILDRASREIGFDFVRVHEQTDEKTWTSAARSSRRRPMKSQYIPTARCSGASSIRSAPPPAL